MDLIKYIILSSHTTSTDSFYIFLYFLKSFVSSVFGSDRSPRCQDVVCLSFWDILQKNIESSRVSSRLSSRGSSKGSSSRQEGKQASRQTSKQESEQASKQESKQVSKQACTKRAFSQSHAMEGLVFILDYM